MDSETTFGQWLKLQRRRQGLTQETLGGLAGVSGIYLRKIEAGERQPTRPVVESLLDALRVPAAARAAILDQALAASTAARSTPRATLPAPLTPLIGRERERASIVRLLRRADARLVTLTGVGGVGKTRLAIEAGSAMLDDFSDGVYFVDLSPIRDPAFVASTIAQALKVRSSGRRSIVDALREYLRPRGLLLALDNFEQVVDAAPLVADLLTAAPGVKALVTSRAVLNVRGERVFDVPPLTLPDAQRPLSAESLLAYDAARLFVERALDARPDFAVTEGNAASIAEICRRLDGLPLAIELAASRVTVFPPERLLERLDRRLVTLTVSARDVPARQQTLRDTISWSYDLLNDDEKSLFRRVAVFAGGCSLDAVEKVCAPAGEADLDVVNGLQSLIGKSLLRQGDRSGGEPRFTCLETLREYGLEQLAASGEAEAICGQHADYFLHYAETLSARLRSEARVEALDALEREHDNLRQAFAWALDREAAEFVVRLAIALGGWWDMHGHLAEGRQAIDQALRLADQHPVARQLRARLLMDVYNAAFRHGDYAAATAAAAQSLALYEAEGDRLGITRATLALGTAAWTQLDLDAARRYLAEGLRLARAWGFLDSACLAIYTLACVALSAGDHAGAQTLLDAEWPVIEASANPRFYYIALCFLGTAVMYQGDWGRAKALLQDALRLMRQAGERVFATYTLDALAGVAAREGQGLRAVRLLAAAYALVEAIDLVLSPAQLVIMEPITERVRAVVDTATFDQAWAAGRAMPVEQAIAYALEEEEVDG